MSQRRMVRLMAFVFALLALAVEVVHLAVDRPERFREVYGGAVQIVHPDHWIRVTDATINPVSTSVYFWGDKYGGSRDRFLQGSVSVNVFRQLSKSLPPGTGVTDALRLFGGGQGVDDEAKAQARRDLANMSDQAFATAIVELTDSLGEEAFAAAFADLVDTRTDTSFLFLSDLDSGMGKPIFWRPCAIYSAVECEQTSSLQLYRRWVSQISWLDTLGLAQMGLDVSQLREAAREGHVYGLLTYGYPKSRLIDMLNMAEVRTIRVVETWGS